MIIGHIPLGYLSTKLIAAKWLDKSINRKPVLLAGIAGSITPDIDMLYYYFVDNCQHHHHMYWTHIPFFWVLLLVFLLWCLKKEYLPFLGIYGVNIFIHLFADTIVGDIWWFFPIIDKPYSLFIVPALYKPWWFNFILHWSFLIEFTILFSAVILFLHSRKNRGGIS